MFNPFAVSVEVLVSPPLKFADVADIFPDTVKLDKVPNKVIFG